MEADKSSSCLNLDFKQLIRYFWLPAPQIKLRETREALSWQIKQLYGKVLVEEEVTLEVVIVLAHRIQKHFSRLHPANKEHELNNRHHWDHDIDL